jgi:hypothetical protein
MIVTSWTTALLYFCLPLSLIPNAMSSSLSLLRNGPQQNQRRTTATIHELNSLFLEDTNA